MKLTKSFYIKSYNRVSFFHKGSELNDFFTKIIFSSSLGMESSTIFFSLEVRLR